MCYPTECETCGNTTWGGCGKHIDEVMAGIPMNQRCTCNNNQQIQQLQIQQIQQQIILAQRALQIQDARNRAAQAALAQARQNAMISIQQPIQPVEQNDSNSNSNSQNINNESKSNTNKQDINNKENNDDNNNNDSNDKNKDIKCETKWVFVDKAKNLIKKIIFNNDENNKVNFEDLVAAFTFDENTSEKFNEAFAEYRQSFFKSILSHVSAKYL